MYEMFLRFYVFQENVQVSSEFIFFLTISMPVILMAMSAVLYLSTQKPKRYGDSTLVYLLFSLTIVGPIFACMVVPIYFLLSRYFQTRLNTPSIQYEVDSIVKMTIGYKVSLCIVLYFAFALSNLYYVFNYGI